MRTTTALLLCALGALGALACGPAVKRDLSQVPAGQVGFDDLCGLQSYFDVLSVKKDLAPTLVTANDIERAAGGRGGSGGRGRFAFETDFQLRTLKRVLDENWKRLPEELATARKIEVEVSWSEKAGVRRVVTEQDAELTVGQLGWSLPYHPCLSELLYGAPLYQRRREALGLPPLEPVLAPSQPAAADPSPAAPAASSPPSGIDGGVAPLRILPPPDWSKPLGGVAGARRDGGGGSRGSGGGNGGARHSGADAGAVD